MSLCVVGTAKQGNKAVKLLHGELVGRATKITKPGCPPNVLFRVCSGFSKDRGYEEPSERRQGNPQPFAFENPESPFREERARTDR